MIERSNYLRISKASQLNCSLVVQRTNASRAFQFSSRVWSLHQHCQKWRIWEYFHWMWLAPSAWRLVINFCRFNMPSQLRPAVLIAIMTLSLFPSIDQNCSSRPSSPLLDCPGQKMFGSSNPQSWMTYTAVEVPPGTRPCGLCDKISLTDPCLATLRWIEWTYNRLFAKAIFWQVND